MSIETIERLTREHAVDRALLAERMQSYQDEIESLKRRRLPGIKSAVSAAKDSHLQLHAAINSERALFAKPKSRVFHGIKVGLQKAKGKLSFANAANVVKLIRKHFADQADVLIKTKESPVKDALLNLSAADLKKLGCMVTATSDEVLIKPADSEIDKLVDALMNGKDDQDAEDKAA